MMDFLPAFILGLVGSFHCAGMCGPFALALPSTSGGATALSPGRFFLGRLGYNLGRILTYCALGLLLGLVGKTLWLAGAQRWLSLALGLALIIGLFASKLRLKFTGRAATLVERLKRPLASALRRPSFTSAVVVGLLNGLLPCGLVYVACAAATATFSPLRAVAYMAVFGTGTLPIMLCIGLSGRLIPFSLRLKLQRAVPVTVFLLASLLVLRSLNVGLPGLVSSLSTHSAPQCCVAK